MSDLSPAPDASVCVSEPTGPVFETLPGRLTDLGGLPIRRLLPRRQRRLVGAWCFLDSYGPLTFSTGKPMDVAPHPHIGLQTVSWLLDGELLHRDSLGSAAAASAGDLNLMTAGSGIAHSEETPPANAGRLRGLQLWLALPARHRHTSPSFDQHRALPVVDLGGGRATVIVGELGGARSPARAFSGIVGAELSVEPDSRVVVPLEDDFEHAVVVLDGDATVDGRPAEVDALVYLGCQRRELAIEARGPARAFLLGGAPFEESIVMWWNFVGRSSDELAAAREDWEAGRGFGEVPGYDGRRLSAPPFVRSRR